MKLKLIEITREPTWKGAWYHKGERHFVVPDTHYPMLTNCKYLALQGGVVESDCQEVPGLRAWLQRIRATVERLG
jgi:hypothetical protein